MPRSGKIPEPNDIDYNSMQPIFTLQYSAYFIGIYILYSINWHLLRALPSTGIAVATFQIIILYSTFGLFDFTLHLAKPVGKVHP